VIDIFFDTSVLVAASISTHQHHAQALPVVQRVVNKKDHGFISNHAIAEMFAVLTRLPIIPRLHPGEVMRIVTDTVLPHFQTIPLTQHDYREAISLMESGGWRGGKIYDALHLRCAVKSKAERVYTFNVRDFRSLSPPELQNKICAP